MVKIVHTTAANIVLSTVVNLVHTTAANIVQSIVVRKYNAQAVQNTAVKQHCYTTTVKQYRVQEYSGILVQNNKNLHNVSTIHILTCSTNSPINM